MANKKLLWFLNAQVCVLVLLTIYNLTKDVAGSTVTATGGSVDSVISVALDPKADDRNEIIERATNRGHYTASEFSVFEGIDIRTVYRRLESGVITNAEKVDGRWRIYCD